MKLAHSLGICTLSYTSFSPPFLSSIITFFSFSNSQLTPLQIAAASNKAMVVSSLTSHGADVNARDLLGYTPLMIASYRGYADVVAALLDAGADKTLKITGERTALDFAQIYQWEDIVALLEQK